MRSGHVWGSSENAIRGSGRGRFGLSPRRVSRSLGLPGMSVLVRGRWVTGLGGVVSAGVRLRA